MSTGLEQVETQMIVLFFLVPERIRILLGWNMPIPVNVRPSNPHVFQRGLLY